MCTTSHSHAHMYAHTNTTHTHTRTHTRSTAMQKSMGAACERAGGAREFGGSSSTCMTMAAAQKDGRRLTDRADRTRPARRAGGTIVMGCDPWDNDRWASHDEVVATTLLWMLVSPRRDGASQDDPMYHPKNGLITFCLYPDIQRRAPF